MPAVNASIAVTVRRTRATSHVRYRKANNESAIRLPPGSTSAIAAYDPTARIQTSRRALNFSLFKEASSMN